MAAYIHNLATAVPPYVLDQAMLREKMKTHIHGRPATGRIIHQLYKKSGINKRHTVIHDFAEADRTPFFFSGGRLQCPTTGQRNERYTRYAKELYLDVARQLLDGTDLRPSDITHVITVSCTGFFAPEPAFEIIQALGLSPATQRFHVGFMGCFAAFPALKMARAFCSQNPDAKVLVVSVELCTLHLQASAEPDQLVSAAVFADGAAGALITASPPKAGRPAYRLNDFYSTVAANSQGDMAWTIGDTGFDMTLSSYVPDIIGGNIRDALHPLLDAYNCSINDIDQWAVHPGGRAILDKIEENLAIPRLRASRSVLASYGNMSSATVLFVLKKLLDDDSPGHNQQTLAMAFGPGLTIESGHLTKIN